MKFLKGEVPQCLVVVLQPFSKIGRLPRNSLVRTAGDEVSKLGGLVFFESSLCSISLVGDYHSPAPIGIVTEFNLELC